MLQYATTVLHNKYCYSNWSCIRTDQIQIKNEQPQGGCWPLVAELLPRHGFSLV